MTTRHAAPALPLRHGGVSVKVCGLTRARDAALAADLGAAALGVVLAPSPRRVTPERAAQVLSAAPSHLIRVGVFVDPVPAFVADAVAACGLHWVQLSGREPAERALAIRDAVRAVADPDRPSLGLLRAVHVGSAADLAAMAGYPADAFLLDSPPLRDAHGVEQMGGTGRTFGWTAAAGVPWPRSRVALAGGLTADNVAEAAARVRPALVDISSGVESAPGIKDAARLARFLEAARSIVLEEPECPKS